MKRVLTVLMALCCLAVAAQTTAQTTAQTNKPLKFHGKPDYLLEVQGEYLFRAVDEGLDAFPPVPGADLKRQLALYNLDALLHDYRYDNSPALRAFIEKRLTKLLADLNKPHKKGLKIYKIYNEAMIARTKSVNIAFDISRCRCRGSKGPLLPNELIKQIVEKCDVLFLSHNHGDHVDPDVVQQFIKAGKPVVATPEILADMAGVTHLRNDDVAETYTVQLKNGKKLSVTIHPGHQGKLQNNIYAVATPEKYVVCHTGDQHHRGDVKWYADIKKASPRVDALIVNCWTNSLGKLLAGIDPRYVITGHENEMGHPIDHREAFWLTFTKFEPHDYNYVVMAWGEWFTIK